MSRSARAMMARASAAWIRSRSGRGRPSALSAVISLSAWKRFLLARTKPCPGCTRVVRPSTHARSTACRDSAAALKAWVGSLPRPGPTSVVYVVALTSRRSLPWFANARRRSTDGGLRRSSAVPWSDQSPTAASNRWVRSAGVLVSWLVAMRRRGETPWSADRSWSMTSMA